MQVRMGQVVLHAPHRTRESNGLYFRFSFGTDQSRGQLYVLYPNGDASYATAIASSLRRLRRIGLYDSLGHV